jgi:single-stranded-DNA-specific exonuclease
MISKTWIAEQRDAFEGAVAGFDRRAPVRILTHNDADGLAAAALLARAFPLVGVTAQVRILGRGENPWSEAIGDELRAQAIGGLIVTDLGVRPGPLRPDTPTIIIDHHVPVGAPPDVTVISGHGQTPTPTSSLLAFWCAGALTDVDDLVWIAALGIVGDLGDRADFEELAAARRRHGASVLREATTLINAPRRAAAADARPALDLLMKAAAPREIASGQHPETALLFSARDEVKAAFAEGKRAAPKFSGPVALIRLHSPCQIHPLVAQRWRTRLKNNIVIAANTGYRPGWVHFSVRSATGVNLIDFLRERAPESADADYGGGHEQASGGALRADGWNEFVAGLGFGPEAQVRA